MGTKLLLSDEEVIHMKCAKPGEAEGLDEVTSVLEGATCARCEEPLDSEDEGEDVAEGLDPDPEAENE